MAEARKAGENVPAAYFEAMYRDGDDPWSLASRWYERRKYGLTAAALPRARYRRAFEPGCSAGVLTALLAERCDELLSWDREARAVAAARARVAGEPGARVERGMIPDAWPEGSFDLIVLSEILYYFDEQSVERVLSRAVESLEAGGTLVAVHWRHPVPDHARSAEAVHAAVRATPGLARLAEHVEADFLLEVFVRADPGGGAPAVSVAAAEGLL